jgi:hypothetical protein
MGKRKHNAGRKQSRVPRSKYNRVLPTIFVGPKEGIYTKNSPLYFLLEFPSGTSL